MSGLDIVRPGDRPRFVEGWRDLRNLPPEFDMEYLTIQSLCRIIDLSQQAVDMLAESYRGFKVGAAVLALDEPGMRTGIYFGGNLTPYEGADWNCAEKRALETVESRGFNRALAIAVSGQPQVDVSGVESPTLHPCYKCRDMFEQSGLVLPDTLIATSTPSGDAYELHTLASLIKRHAEKKEQPFPGYHNLLPFYWNQILTYDAEDERADMERLDKIALITNPPIR